MRTAGLRDQRKWLSLFNAWSQLAQLYEPMIL